MANRSYLYTVDAIPGYGSPGRIEDLSEWKSDVPALHRVLLTGSPMLCHSMLWDSPMQAIAGDYDTGVANLERFFAALPKTDEVREHTSQALAVLKNPARRRNHLLLEVGEIVDLGMISDPDENYHEWATEMIHALESELAEIGDIDGWIDYASKLRPDDRKKLDAATGAGYWPNVLYFTHDQPAQPPAPAEPEPPAPDPQPAPVVPEFAPPAPPVQTLPPQVPPVQLAPIQQAPFHQAPIQHPYVMRPGRVPTGSVTWAVGLLALIPFPVVASIGAGLLMGFQGRAQRRNGSLAAANGRYGGNWGFTYLLLSVILWTVHFVLLYLFTKDGPASGFYPIGTALTIWAGLTLVHVIVCIVGLRKAGKGQVLQVPAIPFLRA